MAGATMHAFYTGRRAGIETTVEYLIHQGALELDEESPSL